MIRHTVCRLCSACCPVQVEVVSGRLVGAARKSSMPAGQSLPCPRLEAAADIVYSPTRLSHPLIKEKGKRGEHYREADWDEALDRIAEHFHFFKQRHGAESIAWLRGMAADWGAPWDYVNRLMNAFGSPNSIGNGSVCHVARDMAHVLTYGAMTVPQPKKARCILVWGKNDRHTGPAVHEGILQGRKKGARLIVIDPVRTELAEAADIWLRIKPAHDGPLAMAMIEHLLAENLYDREFVENWTIGIEDLRQACKPFAADCIAAELWLDPENIKAAARLYAGNSPACIIDGNGLDMQLEVFDATRAVCCLRALTGNLDGVGGDLLPQPVPARNIQLRERLPEDVRPVTAQYDLFNRYSATWGHQVQSCLIDAILEEKPYPVRMLVVQSGNPAVTLTDSHRVRQALQKLEFLVVIDLFMTRTARFADVVLPAGSCFEKTQLNRAFLRNNRVVLQNQVIDWQGKSWPDWKILFELAGRLGLKGDFPWQTVEDAIDYQLAPSGINVQALRENPRGLMAEKTRYRKYRQEGFATPSGKVELSSARLADQGHEPVPFGGGWAGNPITFADYAEEYPLVGISGARTGTFTHSQFHDIPALLQEEGEGCIDLHPRDAEKLNLESGERVQLKTPRGRVRMTARLSSAVPLGSVRVAWGWGEVDPAANLNNLTDDSRRNAVTGTPGCRSFMCRVDKVIRE